MPERLGTDVSDEVRGGVGVAVGVAVEAGDAAARAGRAAVFRGIELLLRERRKQEPQAIELFGIQDAVEECEEIVEGHHLSLRHIAKVGAGCQENRRGELRQEMIGQIEIEVEPRQIALLLPLEFIDHEEGKHHAAFGMVWMRERHETGGKNVLRANFIRSQRSQHLPRDAGLKPGAHSLLHGLSPRHRDAIGRPVGKVVAFREEFLVGLHDPRLRLLHAPLDRVERFLDLYGHVARSLHHRVGCRLCVHAANAEHQG